MERVVGRVPRVLFSPLVPVIPAKVRIKVYPPFRFGVDFSTSEDLSRLMNELMDRQDVPAGEKRKYRLNGLERFMLANEHERVAYNSQFVFEFTHPVSREKLLETTERWISVFPPVRSVIERRLFWDQRFVYRRAWFSSREIFHFEDRISQEAIDRFCGRHFDLAFEPAVRFLLQQEGDRARLIFNCHHSLFDGAGQAYAFEIWSKIYNGSDVQGEVDVKAFRYRFVRHQMGWKKSLALLWRNFSLKPPRKMPKLGTLNDFPDQGEDRLVSSVTLDVSGEPYQDLRSQFLVKAAEVVDRVLAEKGNREDPFIIYAPAGLRWVMKAHSTFQNAVVSQTLFFGRNLPRDEIKRRVEQKSKGDIFLENARFLFGTLPLSYLTPSRKLEKKLRPFDQAESPITCTMLAVHAPIPRAFPVPKDWRDLRISARGTLMRSPCIGLILTGQRGRETLTIEYLPSLVSKATVELVMRRLSTIPTPP